MFLSGVASPALALYLYFPINWPKTRRPFHLLNLLLFCRHLARSDSPRSLLPLIHHIISLNRATPPCSAMALRRCPRFTPPHLGVSTRSTTTTKRRLVVRVVLSSLSIIYLHASCDVACLIIWFRCAGLPLPSPSLMTIIIILFGECIAVQRGHAAECTLSG